MNMQIHYPHLRTRARNIFRMIYKDQRIDVSGSRNTLKEQLDLYFSHLSQHLGKSFSEKDRVRVMDIIVRNNRVGDIINSPEFKKITENKLKLLGNTALGMIYCIDGRIPTIFLGGRYAYHWEVPAAELKVSKRKSDHKLIPESSDLCEALRKLVTSEKDLFEIVLAHTSLLDPHHGCGAMAAKRKQNLLPSDISNEEANLRIIENQTLPAITNLYNDFRTQKGFDPLIQVGISGIYDTDTFGIIFNFSSPKKKLSTTDLANQYKDQIEEYFVKDNLVFGGFKERFHYLKYLSMFTKNVLKITEVLLSKKAFEPFQTQVKEYINTNYPNLTDSQKQAFMFIIMRTVAFQYLIGACNVSKKSLSHPFAKHEEAYMAVSTRGTTLGKYDPESQGFSSTPADPQTAIANIKTKLSIMSGSKSNKSKASLLFICNPVNVRDLQENSIQLHKVMDANAELFRAILEDKDLRVMIENNELLLVPVLLNEDNQEVLKIVDHSAYI